MNREQMERWLAHLQTMVEGLDHIDPKLLPPSFAAEVLTPIRTGKHSFEKLKYRLRILELANDMAQLSLLAGERCWFFWEKAGEILADFARAESCTFLRWGSGSVLNKIHPVQAEEDTKEHHWPDGREEDLIRIEEAGPQQTLFLRIGARTAYPLVLQFESANPVPLILSEHLESMLEAGETFFEILIRHVPDPPMPKSLEIVAESEEEKETAPRILGEEPSFLKALKSVEQAATSDASVFLMGESGTGKELFAKHLHQLSGRSEGPFVPINCSAIPHELIESEMFGHEKGAFTGAYYRKIGKVEQAHGGTLFLDEIGEMPLPFQAKLLRYLQEKKFSRVGGNAANFSDARIVTATHRDLKRMVAEKAFREDLYYRINVIPVSIPPLRERGKDILLLSRFFFKKYISKSRASRRKVDETVFDALEQYDFPGNVRELENIIQRTVVMTQKPVIHVEDLPEEVRTTHERPPLERFRLHPFEKFDHFLPQNRETLKSIKREVDRVAFSYQRDLDRRFLLYLLEQSNGSARKAAELASINRTLFYKLLKRAGLDIGLLNKSGT